MPKSIKGGDLQSIILFNLVQAIKACIDIGSHIIGDSEWETPARTAPQQKVSIYGDAKSL
jgi:hypothetical protein